MVQIQPHDEAALLVHRAGGGVLGGALGNGGRVGRRGGCAESLGHPYARSGLGPPIRAGKIVPDGNCHLVAHQRVGHAALAAVVDGPLPPGDAQAAGQRGVRQGKGGAGFVFRGVLRLGVQVITRRDIAVGIQRAQPLVIDCDIEDSLAFVVGRHADQMVILVTITAGQHIHDAHADHHLFAVHVDIWVFGRDDGGGTVLERGVVGCARGGLLLLHGFALLRCTPHRAAHHQTDADHPARCRQQGAVAQQPCPGEHQRLRHGRRRGRYQQQGSKNTKPTTHDLPPCAV